MPRPSVGDELRSEGAQARFVVLPTDGFDNIDNYRRHQIAHLRASKMNIVRCAFVDENGVQCPATSGTPYADGWCLFAMPDDIEAKKGWYCRDHSRALGHDLHDDKAA